MNITATSTAIEIATSNNFRDISQREDASPYTTLSGESLNTGVFYRSSFIGLQSLDTDAWQQLGISSVYDLRTPAEVKAQPDTLPTDVAYRHVNVLDMDNVMFGSLTSASQTVAFMEDLQRKMVTEASIRQGFATVLTQMAQGRDAQLFHCSGGKDRTGWIAALLLSHAGLSTDDVMQNYLLSNARLNGFIEQTYEAVAERYGQSAADAIRPALTVQESFLAAGLHQISESFGSLEQYLQNGLGLSATLLDQLRLRLLGTQT